MAPVAVPWAPVQGTSQHHQPDSLALTLRARAWACTPLRLAGARAAPYLLALGLWGGGREEKDGGGVPVFRLRVVSVAMSPPTRAAVLGCR